MTFYTISYVPFYDQIMKVYKHIYIIDRNPGNDTSLNSIVKPISSPPLSTFSNHATQCLYAIYNPENNNKLLEIGEETLLFSYLIQNNYIVNTEITEIMRKVKNLPNNGQLLCIIYKI